MLLRRITKHVTGQNWFAVFIDFLIVVVGVFIGIQVANWNEARVEQTREVAFRERLSEDVNLARDKLAEFIEIREIQLQSIAQVEDMYFGDAEVQALSEQVCNNLSASHILTHPPSAVPSITEAFAGGRIDLIKDPDLIRALISVKQSEERLTTVIQSLNQDQPVLHQKYPNAIRKIRATKAVDQRFTNGAYQAGALCPFTATSPDPAFLSDIVSAMSQNSAYVSFLSGHAEKLDALAEVLNGVPASHSKEITQ